MQFTYCTNHITNKNTSSAFKGKDWSSIFVAYSLATAFQCSWIRWTALHHHLLQANLKNLQLQISHMLLPLKTYQIHTNWYISRMWLWNILKYLTRKRKNISTFGGWIIQKFIRKKPKSSVLQDICLTSTKTQAPGAYRSRAICLTLFMQVVVFTSAKKINMYKQKISSPSPLRVFDLSS